MRPNTLYMRLEGPLQAWGSHESKFFVRRTMDVPSKSGLIGLLCAAMGYPRDQARDLFAPFSALKKGVRIDRPGVRWWDYQTVGAGMNMRIAEGEGKVKPGPMLSRREYLCDASFLVALKGDPELIQRLADAMASPRWTPYLGRKCCPPSRPINEHPAEHQDSLLDALRCVPWARRCTNDAVPETLDCILDWTPTPAEPEAPPDAEIRYDVPVSFEPPAHIPRFVVRSSLSVGGAEGVPIQNGALVSRTPQPTRPRADYSNSQYQRVRAERLKADANLCVFCKAPATTVQHITYRRAGGDEKTGDLRSLCRLCHDAVTMLEYGAGMGLDRIDPEDPAWRERIIAKRRDIIAFRSIETRRRRLAAEEVE